MSVTSTDHKGFVKEKFDFIVKRYDLVNSVASFFQDAYWRKRLVKSLGEIKGPLLDLCCGPYTLSLEILRSKKLTLYALDLSFEMLSFGRLKLKEYTPYVFPLKGDAEKLPFKGESVEAITIAFGFRNLPNRKEALEEFSRVLKKGGSLLILEFSLPKNVLIKKLYLLYLKYYIPLLGGLLTGDKEAYQYLAKSIQDFPSSEEIDYLLQSTGFIPIKVEKLTFGIVTLYHYKKR